MSAIGYTRISEKDQSNNSLNNQAQGITDYCKNNNIHLEKIFTDNGKSAFTFDRPEWLKLEAYIKKNKQIRYLIVYHIDRFSRATLMDALIKLNEIEVKLKVKVLTVTDPVNMDSSDLGVQLMRTINLLFSNNERNRIQDRVKDGIYRSMASGRFCNMAPVGYLNSKQDGKPLLVIDPVKSPFIKKVFKLYNQGMNVERIRKEVPELKLTGNSAVQRILLNPLYAGIINLPAYKGKPAMEIDAIHKPIVAKYEYYAAANKAGSRHIVSQPTEDVWLRGMIYCHCGRLMTAGNSKGKLGKMYWYYKCNTHRDKNYPAAKLHKQFLDVLDVLSLDKNSVEFIRQKLKQSIEDHQSKKGGNIMRLKLELSKAQKKIEDTQTKYLLNPDIDVNVYSRVMTELKETATGLEEKIIRFATDTNTMVTMLDELLPKLENLSKAFMDMSLHQKQLFIGVQLSRPLVYFDGFYTTPAINSIFAHKALELKQKNLLKVEQVNDVFAYLQTSTPDGSCIQPLIDDLELLLKVFAA